MRLNDVATDRDLVQRYAELCALTGGISASVRGMRFNQVIADALQRDGIDAEADARGPRGEVDVAFAYDGTWYLLEAKWEAEPIDADPVRKLHDVLSERHPGTMGILASWSGFNDSAVRRAVGVRNVILFDRVHIEALLAGVATAQELISAANRAISVFGHEHAAVAPLLRPRRTAETPVALGGPEGVHPGGGRGTECPGCDGSLLGEDRGQRLEHPRVGPPPFGRPARFGLHLIKVLRRDQLRQGDVAEPLVPEPDVIRAVDRQVREDGLLQQPVEQALAPSSVRQQRCRDQVDVRPGQPAPAGVHRGGDLFDGVPNEWGKRRGDVHKLVKALRYKPDELVRREAALALGDREVVAVLVEAMASDVCSVAGAAATSLRSIGATGAPVEDLVDALVRSRRWHVEGVRTCSCRWQSDLVMGVTEWSGRGRTLPTCRCSSRS